MTIFNYLERLDTVSRTKQRIVGGIQVFRKHEAAWRTEEYTFFCCRPHLCIGIKFSIWPFRPLLGCCCHVITGSLLIKTGRGTKASATNWKSLTVCLFFFLKCVAPTPKNPFQDSLRKPTLSDVSVGAAGLVEILLVDEPHGSEETLMPLVPLLTNGVQKVFGCGACNTAGRSTLRCCSLGFWLGSPALGACPWISVGGLSLNPLDFSSASESEFPVEGWQKLDGMKTLFFVTDWEGGNWEKDDVRSRLGGGQ